MGIRQNDATPPEDSPQKNNTKTPERYSVKTRKLSNPMFPMPCFSRLNNPKRMTALRIGEALARRFEPRFTVAGFDVKPPKVELEDFHWFECDLTDKRSIADSIDEVAKRFGNRIASVIHLAAYYDFSGKPSPLYQDLTVEGTRHLITLVKDLEVEQFIFSSSLLVMEPVKNEDEVLTETSETKGEWDYPSSKIEAETVLLNEHYKIPLVILRLAGVYNDDCHSIPLSHHISRIFEEELESYVFPGETEHGQPYVHLEDLVDCVVKTVERRGDLSKEEIFLIAEPDVMSQEDLQEHLGELIHGREWPTIRIPKFVAKAGAWAKNKLTREEEFIKPWMIDLADDHYPVEIDKARKKLGWSPNHRLRERLPMMIEKLWKNPVRWYETNDLPVPHKVLEKSARIEAFRGPKRKVDRK